MIRPLDELLTLIASGMTTEEVANFQVSPTAKSVLEDLIHRQKTTGLSAEEIAELESFLQLEQIMQLAKAKARVLLGK